MDLKIEESSWKKPEGMFIKCKLFTSCIVLTSKGGREIKQNVFSNVVITRKEEIKNRSIGKIKNLVVAKENYGRKVLKDYVESLLYGRHGIKGYRGYFKFVKVENANL